MTPLGFDVELEPNDEESSVQNGSEHLESNEGVPLLRSLNEFKYW